MHSASSRYLRNGFYSDHIPFGNVCLLREDRTAANNEKQLEFSGVILKSSLLLSCNYSFYLIVVVKDVVFFAS